MVEELQRITRQEVRALLGLPDGRVPFVDGAGNALLGAPFPYLPPWFRADSEEEMLDKGIWFDNGERNGLGPLAVRTDTLTVLQLTGVNARNADNWEAAGPEFLVLEEAPSRFDHELGLIYWRFTEIVPGQPETGFLGSPRALVSTDSGTLAGRQIIEHRGNIGQLDRLRKILVLLSFEADSFDRLYWNREDRGRLRLFKRTTEDWHSEGEYVWFSRQAQGTYTFDAHLQKNVRIVGGVSSGNVSYLFAPANFLTFHFTVQQNPTFLAMQFFVDAGDREDIFFTFQGTVRVTLSGAAPAITVRFRAPSLGLDFDVPRVSDTGITQRFELGILESQQGDYGEIPMFLEINGGIQGTDYVLGEALIDSPLFRWRTGLSSIAPAMTPTGDEQTSVNITPTEVPVRLLWGFPQGNQSLDELPTNHHEIGSGKIEVTGSNFVAVGNVAPSSWFPKTEYFEVVPDGDFRPDLYPASGESNLSALQNVTDSSGTPMIQKVPTAQQGVDNSVSTPIQLLGPWKLLARRFDEVAPGATYFQQPRLGVEVAGATVANARQLRIGPGTLHIIMAHRISQGSPSVTQPGSPKITVEWGFFVAGELATVGTIEIPESRQSSLPVFPDIPVLSPMELGYKVIQGGAMGDQTRVNIEGIIVSNLEGSFLGSGGPERGTMDLSFELVPRAEIYNQTEKWIKSTEGALRGLPF